MPVWFDGKLEPEYSIYFEAVELNRMDTGNGNRDQARVHRQSYSEPVG